MKYLAYASLIIIAISVGIVGVSKIPSRQFTITPEEEVAIEPVRIEVPKYQILDVVVSRTFYRIIECESNFCYDVCNEEFGCIAGQGLAQLIPSTVEYCEKKLGKDIDPFNPQDNLECALWLYRNEGTRHWGCIDCSWGSYHCWGS